VLCGPGPLLGRKGESGLEELEKRRFSRIGRTNDQDAKGDGQSLRAGSGGLGTYLKGVGSFLLRTLLGLLMVLTALLA
jgi:hypothetical protein